MNNKICKTYIVKESKIKEIRIKLNIKPDGKEQTAH